MKKHSKKKNLKNLIIKIAAAALALILVVTGVIFLVFAIQAPVGEYQGAGATVKFSPFGVKVTVDDFTYNGKYEFGKDDEGNKTITITLDELDEDATLLKKGCYAVAYAAVEGTRAYEKGKNEDGEKIFKLAGITFTKK